MIETGAGVRTFVLTGDAGPERLARAHERGFFGPPDTDIDALELPHHGSFNAVALDTVGRGDPAIVVQSTGPSRLGDERWDAVRPGRGWYITARDGAIATIYRTDGTITASPTAP